jgi:hypothetical protein
MIIWSDMKGTSTSIYLIFENENDKEKRKENIMFPPLNSLCNHTIGHNKALWSNCSVGK